MDKDERKKKEINPVVAGAGIVAAGLAGVAVGSALKDKKTQEKIHDTLHQAKKTAQIQADHLKRKGTKLADKATLREKKMSEKVEKEADNKADEMNNQAQRKLSSQQ